MTEPTSPSGSTARPAPSVPIPDLESLLSSLPRSEASPRFTAGVLRRLAGPAPAASGVRWRDWAWGGLAIAVAAVLGAVLGPYLATRTGENEVPFSVPRISTPRISTPRISTPRIGAPRTSAPGIGEAPRIGEPRVEVATLRDEVRALEDELAELRQLIAASSPVVGLGASDRVDYVVDLRELIGGGAAVPVSQPAGNR